MEGLLKRDIWFRRLYHQKADQPPSTGEDLGLGPDSPVVVDDHYQAARISAAASSVDRLRATSGYLHKVLRQLDRAVDATQDPTLAYRVEDILDSLTTEILRSITSVKTELRDYAGGTR